MLAKGKVTEFWKFVTRGEFVTVVQVVAIAFDFCCNWKPAAGQGQMITTFVAEGIGGGIQRCGVEATIWSRTVYPLVVVIV